jgi:HPt (histidine-containing phosphotransfer) domain-containing protein
VSEDSPLAIPQGYEPCEECGAPLDPQQRYCVECAARRGNGSNPASRYFAAMSKKSRRPLTKTQTKGSGGGSRAAAVGFFALLPIAVALGVVVGRSGSGNSNEDALLKALHQAEQQQVAAAPVVTEEAATAPTTASTNKAKGTAKNAKNGGKAASKNEAKTAAKNAGTNATKSKQGAVEKIETYKPSKEDVEEDTKLVEENPEQTGENYIKAQQNLPEVIVIGGEEETGSSSGSELPPGVEP